MSCHGNGEHAHLCSRGRRGRCSLSRGEPGADEASASGACTWWSGRGPHHLPPGPRRVYAWWSCRARAAGGPRRLRREGACLWWPFRWIQSRRVPSTAVSARTRERKASLPRATSSRGRSPVPTPLLQALGAPPMRARPRRARARPEQARRPPHVAVDPEHEQPRRLTFWEGALGGEDVTADV